MCVVVGPQRRRDRVFRGRCRALVDGADDGRLVDGHGEGAAHAGFVEGRLLGVEGQVADIQALLRQQFQSLVLCDLGGIAGLGSHDVAFAGFQLGSRTAGLGVIEKTSVSMAGPPQ